MGDVLELLKSLDGPSKAASAFLVVLVGLALKMFPRETSVQVKLVVFFTLVTFAGGGLYFSGRNAQDSAQAADPHPGPEHAQPMATKIGQFWEGLSPVGVAHAQSSEGWMFLGKYDQAAGRWTEGPLGSLPDATRVPRLGETIATTGAVDLYDTEPRFSLFSQSWKLGTKLKSLNGGQQLRLVAPPVFVGQNVWCRVTAV